MRPIVIKLIFALFVLANSVPVRADYAVIHTSEGKILRGTIQPAGNGFSITGTNGVATVGLNQLARLTFQPPPNAVGSVTNAPHGLRGTYFSNSDCTGDRVVRIDRQIDFNWQDACPIPGIGPVDFSVRWEGKLLAPATGKFTFYTPCEGVKLWLDNQVIIDKTEDYSSGETAGSIQLTEGNCYNFKMELYNHNLTALARLYWSGPSATSGTVPTENLYAIPLDPADGTLLPKSGLLGLYFNTTDLAGEAIPRFDPKIDFDWGEDAPIDGINAGEFSVRWLGKLVPPASAPYTLQISSQDGARVWLNGNLIIDAWRDEPTTASSRPIPLEAGQKCDLKIETFASRGAGKARLQWSSPSMPLTTVPANCMLPEPAPERDQRAADTLPPGVRLASGSFLASPVHLADETSVQFNTPMGPGHVSLVNVSCLVFQPLTSKFAVKLQAGRPGLLLKNKDFIEGEFKGITQGEIRINSVIFGLKSYPLSEAVALYLREMRPAQVGYELRLKNGSLLHASDVQVSGNSLLVEDSVMKHCRLALADLQEISRPKLPPPEPPIGDQARR